jgi:hypothetical protein
VLIPLSACEHGARPRSPIPPAGKRKQSTANDVADEVLLTDGELTSRPPLADLVQIRDEHFAYDNVEGKTREQTIECRLPTVIVEPLKRMREFVGTFLQQG